MKLWSPRILVLSTLVTSAIGVAVGLIFALVADKLLLYGIASGLLLAGITVLGMGLLGATEPDEGWATARRARSAGVGRHRGAREGSEGTGERRGLVATIAREHGDFESTSSWAVAAWGVIVGGTVIALSMLLFGLA